MNKENIYFCSDLHLGHKNLVVGSSTWTDKSGCRPFGSVKEHDDTIINNWNSVVTNEDVVYHLGDFCFGREGKDAEHYLRRLNFKEFNHINGNHDKPMFRFFNFKDRQDVDGRGVFRCGPYLEINLHGHDFVLFHYPVLRWNGSHKGSIHLWGHEHSHMNKWVEEHMPNLKMMDIGMECINYTPVSIYEILNIMKTRNPTPHHDI